MIWFLCFLFAGLAALYVSMPLWQARPDEAKTSDQESLNLSDGEIQAYQKALTDLEIASSEADKGSGDDQGLGQARLKLQRALLAQYGQSSTVDGKLKKTPMGAIVCLLVMMVGGLGLYSVFGSASLSTKQGVQKSIRAQKSQIKTNPKTANLRADMSLAQLVTRLERALAEDPNSVEGWQLYARSLVSLGRYEEGIIAYDKLMALAPQRPDLVQEHQDAMGYIKRMQGQTLEGQTLEGQTLEGKTIGNVGIRKSTNKPRALSQDEIKNGQAMTGADRSAMIMGMVNGLAARLEDEPMDVQGWKKLIRARSVLAKNDPEQKQQLERELTKLSQIFSLNPEKLNEILAAADLK